MEERSRLLLSGYITTVREQEFETPPENVLVNKKPNRSNFIILLKFKQIKIIFSSNSVHLLYQTMFPTSPASAYKSKNKFNYDARPMHPVCVPSDIQIVSMEISPHGKSAGVLLIESTMGAFVLKANNQCAQDFFFNELALALGVNTPVICTMGCYETPFKKLVFAIQKYCHEDEVLFARLKSKLDFPFYQIMEYIPSIMFANLGGMRLQNYMLADSKLYSLGMCIGFDIIINNNDRFSLVWRGEGNVNNILIQLLQIKPGNIEKARNRMDTEVALDNFVFIDHQGHFIDGQKSLAGANVQKYLSKITEFHLNTIMYLRKQNTFLPPQFQKLCQQFNLYTEHCPSDEELSKICYGIVYVTKVFIDKYESQEIADLHEQIKKKINTKNKSINYWNEHWNRQFEKVCLGFCQLFYIKISAIYTTYPEIVHEIYNKVKAVLEEEELRKENRRRRVSTVLMGENLKRQQKQGGEKQQKQGQQKQGQQKQGEQKQGEQKQKSQMQESQKEKQDQQAQRKRKWRQKLEIFKNQNYKN